MKQISPKIAHVVLLDKFIFVVFQTDIKRLAVNGLLDSYYILDSKTQNVK